MNRTKVLKQRGNTISANVEICQTLVMIWISAELGKHLRGNINISAKKNLSYYELKWNKPCDEEFSEVLRHRKQA
jgi:hypothetical protein